MNGMIDGDMGEHSFSPYFNGDNQEPTATCSVCERELPQSITVKIKECHSIVCEGCARNFDVELWNQSQCGGDMTAEQKESFLKQLNCLQTNIR